MKIIKNSLHLNALCIFVVFKSSIKVRTKIVKNNHMSKLNNMTTTKKICRK